MRAQFLLKHGMHIVYSTTCIFVRAFSKFVNPRLSISMKMMMNIVTHPPPHMLEAEGMMHISLILISLILISLIHFQHTFQTLKNISITITTYYSKVPPLRNCIIRNSGLILLDKVPLYKKLSRLLHVIIIFIGFFSRVHTDKHFLFKLSTDRERLTRTQYQRYFFREFYLNIVLSP